MATSVQTALFMKLGFARKCSSQSLNIAKCQMDKRMLPFPTQKVMADSHSISWITTVACGADLRGTEILTDPGNATSFQFKSQ